MGGVDWLPRRERDAAIFPPLRLVEAVTCRRVWIRAELDWIGIQNKQSHKAEQVSSTLQLGLHIHTHAIPLYLLELLLPTSLLHHHRILEKEEREEFDFTSLSIRLVCLHANQPHQLNLESCDNPTYHLSPSNITKLPPYLLPKGLVPGPTPGLIPRILRLLRDSSSFWLPAPFTKSSGNARPGRIPDGCIITTDT